jgi:K+-sensing histidine kinase KdpD
LLSGDGKTILWDSLFDTGPLLNEQRYLFYDNSHVLKFTAEKKNITIKNDKVFLLCIKPATQTEQEHARTTESKYSQLFISTITHDLKSPITAIQWSLMMLKQYVTSDGINYLNAAQLTASAYEYYLYDLLVILRVKE